MKASVYVVILQGMIAQYGDLDCVDTAEYPIKHPYYDIHETPVFVLADEA